MITKEQPAAPDRPAVAAVVLNHNGRALLLECLGHLAQVPYRPLHTLVVDNASTDGSVEAVQQLYPAVPVLRSQCNRGVAGGRNAGVHWVRQQLDVDYILFLDNDTTVDPGAVKALVDAAESNPQIGLVSPKAFRRKGDRVVLSAGGMRFNPYTGVLRDVGAGQPDRGDDVGVRDVQACPGFAFLIRRTVLDGVGLFDEAFNPYGWEDVDLSLRAARMGYRVVYVPSAVVYHAGGRAGRGIVDIYERHKARNMFTFVRRHTTRFQWLCFLGLLPIRAAGRVGRELLRGNGRLVATWFKALVRRGPDVSETRSPGARS